MHNTRLPLALAAAFALVLTLVSCAAPATTTSTGQSPGGTTVEVTSAPATVDGTAGPVTDPPADTATDPDAAAAAADRQGKGAPRTPCTPQDIGDTLPAGTTCRNVTVDGYTREFLVYVPDDVAEAPTTPVPVVVMYHGSSGTGEQFLKISGWREKADAEGLIAAFPTGLEYFVTKDGANRWSTKFNNFTLSEDIDTTKRLPGYPTTSPWPADDVSFTSEMLDDIGQLHAVDTNRAYATGFSNGGAFVSRLSIELPERIAAVAASAGSVQGSYPVVGHDGVPAPYWLTIGTMDDRFGEALGVDEIPLDPDAAAALPQLDALFTSLPSLWGLPSDPCSIDRTTTTTTFRWCADGRPEARVTLIDGLVHHYAHGFDQKKNPSGVVAADLFWPFFEANPLT